MAISCGEKASGLAQLNDLGTWYMHTGILFKIERLVSLTNWLIWMTQESSSDSELKIEGEAMGDFAFPDGYASYAIYVSMNHKDRKSVV